MSQLKNIFISAATGEFGGYRLRLKTELSFPGSPVIIQEDFIDSSRGTLQKLYGIIKNDCDVVIHLVGRGAGASASDSSIQDFLGWRIADDPKPEEVATKFAALAERLQIDVDSRLTYTQWEAVLAIYLDKVIHVFEAAKDICDGHKEGEKPFSPKADDSASMQSHIKWLAKNVARYSEKFCDYHSLCVGVDKVLRGDLHDKIAELGDRNAYLEEREQEFLKSQAAAERFGNIAPQQIRSLGRRFPTLFSPAFLTRMNAAMNNGAVSWSADDELADGMTSQDYVTDRFTDWVTQHPNKLHFPCFLWLLAKRASSLQLPDVSQEVEGILVEALRHSGSTRNEIELCCQQWLSIATEPDLEGVLQISRHSQQGSPRWCFRFPGVKTVGVELDAEVANNHIIEESRNLVAESLWMWSLGVARVEVFTEVEGMAASWELKANRELHSVPVSVRPPRRPVEWDSIKRPLPPLRKADLPCCVQCAGGDPLLLMDQVREAGAFFALPSDACSLNLSDLVSRASTAIWWRTPVCDPDHAIGLLADLEDEFSPDDLPTIVHRKRQNPQSPAWRECVVMSSSPETEFPRPRKNHQLHLARQ